MHNRVISSYNFKRWTRAANNERDPLGFILFYLDGEDVNHSVLGIQSAWSLWNLIEQAGLHNYENALQELIEQTTALGLFGATSCDP